jgi:hypothetical protein
LENEDVNECWIADRDRFSYEALDSADRLTKPMLKQGGEWKEVDWQTALEYVANGLQGVKAQHGPQAIGTLASPHSTAEELFLAAGLTPIVCVGETLEEREGNRTQAVVTTQINGSLAGLSPSDLEKIVVAYEPVWAIGTGKVATPQQAQEVHALIRGLLAALASPAVAAKVRIQYGGSVKPDNAADLAAQPDIDGALVGGASLKADDFLGIAKAFA